jgi:hypothetical protein
MKTPAGKECRYFYGDYYRGRAREECRLLGSATPPLRWRAELCKTCPVPEILLDNACQYMVFEPFLQRSLPFLKQQVGVRTFCNKTQLRGFDPHIGCGQCHPLPPEFTGEKP